jgi:hypothetical protein
LGRWVEIRRENHVQKVKAGKPPGRERLRMM